MTIDEFWNILAKANREAKPGSDPIEDHLIRALRGLSKEELLDFDAHAASLYHRAYDWNLWDAAFVIGGGCGDDGFMDFRQALVGLGRDRFEGALANPESLADLDEEEEDFLYTESFLDFIYEVLDEDDVPDWEHPTTPTGKPWESEGIEMRFPRLKARFWDADG